jgi:hypothetical protein
MSGYKALGVMAFIYAAYSAYIEEVYAKDKTSGRTIIRSEEKGYFWAVISCYFALSLALFFIF